MNWEEIGKLLLPPTFKEELQQKRDEAVDRLIGEFIEWVKPSLEEAVESGASRLSISKERSAQKNIKSYIAMNGTN